MGTLGDGIISGDWMSRIIKLESEVNNWRIKFEIESLWRKVVEEWIFDEFGFDVSRQTQKLEKNFRKTNIIDVTFSTKNVEVNFGKLKEALTKQSSTDQVEKKQNNNDPNNEASASQLTLKSLPSSISVTEVKTVPLDYKRAAEPIVEVEPHGEVEQSLNISQNPGETINPSEEDGQEIELIDPEKEPSYEFPTVPTEEDGDSDDIIEIDVDAADRTDFPLTIYDLEEDEDETIACADRDEDDVDADTTKFSPIQPSIEESQSYDDSAFYQAEGLEFTAVEGTEDDHEDQDFENCVDQQNLNNDNVSIEEAEEDYPDELEFDPNNLVAVAHDTSNDTKKRPYRARPARSLIQTIVIPGEKRKFQCLACQRIFSDRGNGHRHVRRMHPGQSVHAQKQLGFSVGELTSQFGSSDNDPPLPVLIPEVSLRESPNRSQASTSYSDSSFPDLAQISKGEDNSSSPGRCHLGVNVQLPLGIDIQAVDDPDDEDESEGLPVEDEDDDDDNNEFEDEEEAFLLRDNSQSAIPMSVLRRGEFGDQQCNLQGRLSMEQRREAAKLIRKVNDQFKCIQCSRFFSVSCNARRHARVVHFGERLYECKICQKRFSSKTDGVIHEKFCMDKQGNLLTTLNQHENFPTAVASSSTSVKVLARPRPSMASGVRDKAHLPIRRLRRACGRNGKNVSVPPNVLSTGLISKKVNGKTFYFECKVCRNRYADLRSAWSHAKRMHLTEKPHKCTHCPKSYFNRKDFLKHQLKCGPVEPNEEERDYAERMELDLNFSHNMIPVDPGSLSGQAPDRDLDSPDLGHFLEISEVNEDVNDDDGVANAS